MKVRRILVLIAAAALAQVVYAKAAGEHQAPRPRSLPPPVRPNGLNVAQFGAEQAVIDFCSRIDSSDEKLYEAHAKSLFAGFREDSLEKARGSAQYQDAYKTIGSVVSEIPLPEAVQGCKAIITASKPTQASGKNTAGNTAGHGTGNTTGHGTGNTVGRGTGSTAGRGTGNTGHGVANTVGHSAGNTIVHGASNTTGHGAGNTVGIGVIDTTDHGVTDAAGRGVTDKADQGVTDATGHGVTRGVESRGEERVRE